MPLLKKQIARRVFTAGELVHCRPEDLEAIYRTLKDACIRRVDFPAAAYFRAKEKPLLVKRLQKEIAIAQRLQKEIATRKCL